MSYIENILHHLIVRHVLIVLSQEYYHLSDVFEADTNLTSGFIVN